jgi:hypothetical protein
MSGSIHIHGTNSSIVDTVFVCRHQGITSRAGLFRNAKELAEIVNHELAALANAGMKPTVGDIRCIVFGHITRMTIWNLRFDWNPSGATDDKLKQIKQVMDELATLKEVTTILESLTHR